MSANLEIIKQQALQLTPDEMRELRAALDLKLAPAKPAMTEDEFEEMLEAQGVISLPDRDATGDVMDFKPVPKDEKERHEQLMQKMEAEGILTRAKNPSAISPFRPVSVISKPLSETGVLFEYKGDIYNRPVGRGIVLKSGEYGERGTYLDEAFPDGDYEIEIIVRSKVSQQPLT